MSSSVIEHVAVTESDTFKARNPRRFFDYLIEKRGDGDRPAFSDLDLMDLYDIAPSMCIRDVVNGGEDLKCRYWGGEFQRAYRVDCTGKLVSESYGREGIENTLALHHRALAAERPLRLVGNLGYADKNIDFVTFEGIMACVDGKEMPKQHIFAIGQFDYQLDDEDRKILAAQCGLFFL